MRLLKSVWPFNRSRVFAYKRQPDTGWIEQPDGTYFRGHGEHTYLITAEEYARMLAFQKWESEYFAAQHSTGPRLCDLPPLSNKDKP